MPPLAGKLLLLLSRSPTAIIWRALLSMRSAKLPVEQANTVDTFLRFCSRARILRSFVGRFRAMLLYRTAGALDS
jgi:hypothetical protein